MDFGIQGVFWNQSLVGTKDTEGWLYFRLKLANALYNATFPTDSRKSMTGEFSQTS